MTGMQKAYIYDAIRTPRGIAKEHGSLHNISAYELLTQLFTALTHRNSIDPNDVDDVVLGCVSQFGEQAGNIARSSLIFAGWPDHIPGITINRYCSSSLDATCLAADKIAAQNASLLITGGVECMSRVPMLADKPTWMIDPIIASKTRTIPLGNAADLIATLEGFSREELDSYAQQSQLRAMQAQANGYFNKSIVAVNDQDGNVTSLDESIRGDTTTEQLALLKPAFAELGAKVFDASLLTLFPELTEIEHNHTVGNSPGMVDGASMLLIGDELAGLSMSVKPRAEILGYKTCCGPVEQVLTGGIEAAQMLLEQQNLQPNDLDLVEFNESFAGPTLKFIGDLDLDPDKVNVNGGAISLGHPMGATGGMLLGMLLDELERQDKELGMVSICGATGSGTALLLKRCH